MDRRLFRTLLLLVSMAVVLWGFGLVLWPFMAAISWALCLVAVTLRPYRALATRWGRPRLAAAAMTAATAVGILAPIVLAVLLVVGEARLLSERGFSDVWENIKSAVPGAYEGANRFLARFGTSADEVVQAVTDLVNRWLPGLATQILGGIVGALFGLLVMLATQYFVYRDAARLKRLVHDLLPLDREDVDRILETLHVTTVSAIAGGILVAAAQGVLAGAGYAFVGIRAPVMWAFLTALCSFIPAGGTALVWVPIAVYLFAVGETSDGTVLAAWGVLVLSTSDNLLRPWILGRMGTDAVHPLLLLFSILSGIGLFGMSGILFGPLLIALLTTVTKIYRERVAPALRGE